MNAIVLGPVPGLDRRERVTPRASEIEVAGDGQHGVADRLGIEPPSREAPEPAIVGIDCGVVRVEIARELVGLGKEDLAVDRLDRPAAGDEPGGEPVEQLGMGRRLAAEPEVGRRGDDSPAEVVLPDPVDHDTWRQGIARAASASVPARAVRCPATKQQAAARRPGMRTEGPRAGRLRPDCRDRPAAEARRRPASPR